MELKTTKFLFPGSIYHPFSHAQFAQMVAPVVHFALHEDNTHMRLSAYLLVCANAVVYKVLMFIYTYVVHSSRLYP